MEGEESEEEGEELADDGEGEDGGEEWRMREMKSLVRKVKP